MQGTMSSSFRVRIRSQFGSPLSVGKVAARFAYPTEDHEFLHVCAHTKPTSVPSIDVPQSFCKKGNSP